jgi:protein-disulfide isomerase
MMRYAGYLSAVFLMAAACSPAPTDGPFEPVAIDPFLADAVLGDRNAPVEIVEYASTTCGGCYQLHTTIMPEIKSAYIDTGKVRLVYRVLPTPPAPVSAAGAAIARCAGEEKFHDVIEDLYKSQPDVIRAAQAGDVQSELVRIGGRHGLSANEVRTCIQDPAIRDYTLKVASEAPPYVTSTPSLIINGDYIQENSRDAIVAKIEEKLAAAGASSASGPAAAPSEAP